MIDVAQLTEWESQICTWVGKQRFTNAKKNARDPGDGPPHDNPEMDIRGAHCEFAASIMLNLYWRPTIGRLRDRDVGGLVEVRSTILEKGKLIVKPADDDDAPFVLIVADMLALRFRFGGWLFARQAKAYPLCRDFGDPAHFVEQSNLWPQGDLPRVLDGKR